MKSTDKPKKEFVRIELGPSRYLDDDEQNGSDEEDFDEDENKEDNLKDDYTDYTLKFRLLSGGYLRRMECRSEKYGDTWGVHLLHGIRGGLHFIDFDYVKLAPLEQPRRPEEGEVLCSLVAWPVEEFVDREAREREQRQIVEEMNYQIANTKVNFPHSVSGSRITRLQVFNVEEGISTISYRLLSGKMKEDLEVISETHGDRWVIRRWLQRPTPEPNRRVELKPLDKPRKLEEGEIFSSFASPAKAKVAPYTII